MSVKTGAMDVERENGVVMILAAVAVIGLFGVVAIVIHFGYLSSMQAELQTASDAAALAAAGRLNSTVPNYADAKEAAVKTFNELTALSGVGGDQTFNLDPANSENVWDLTDQKNLRVKIDRGTYFKNKFISFEGVWQSENPMIANFLVANAVQVTVDRPKTTILNSPFGSRPQYSVKTVSTAVSGPTNEVCAAPFAIPICSLIGADGQFMADDVCKGDRLFTRADRYCRPGAPGYPNCKAFPSSPYTPVSSIAPISMEGGEPGAQYVDNIASLDSLFERVNGHDYLWSDLLPKPGTHPQNASYGTHAGGSVCPNDWGWNRKQPFAAVTDHFGVVGLPGEHPLDADLEPTILSYLTGGASGAQTCIPTAVGDKFTVLANGLQTAAADNAIWQIINNDGSTQIANHDRYQRFGDSILGSMDAHIDQFEWMASYDSHAHQMRRQECARDFRYKGICNSHRGKYELTVPASPSQAMGFYFGVYTFKTDRNPDTGLPTISDDNTIWKAKIPVIAQPGQDTHSCQGVSVDGSSPPPKDPDIDPTVPYVIVGFVDVMIYDVDIGTPPPDYQVATIGDDGVEPLPAALRFQENCNYVRARIDCNSRFIPASNSQAFPTARLVSAPEAAP